MDRRTYTNELISIVGSLEPAQRSQFISSFSASEKNPVIMFGLNIWLGGLGVDRFVVGDALAGVLKLLVTLVSIGTLGWVWVLIDCFLIGGRTRDKNIETARNLKASMTGTSPSIQTFSGS